MTSQKTGSLTPKTLPPGGVLIDPISPQTMAILTPAEIETRSLALLNSFAVLHFTAPNDSNGNPRRLWAAFTPAGQLLNAWDEGYVGSHAIPAAIRHKAATCYAIPISAATYRAMLRHARQIAA
jgi:hypothetical protein